MVTHPLRSTFSRKYYGRIMEELSRDLATSSSEPIFFGFESPACCMFSFLQSKLSQQHGLNPTPIVSIVVPV